MAIGAIVAAAAAEVAATAFGPIITCKAGSFVGDISKMPPPSSHRSWLSDLCDAMQSRTGAASAGLGHRGGGSLVFHAIGRGENELRASFGPTDFNSHFAVLCVICGANFRAAFCLVLTQRGDFIIRENA